METGYEPILFVSGFRVYGSGFRVPSSQFLSDSGFPVPKVSGSEFPVPKSGLWVSGLGSRVLGAGMTTPCTSWHRRGWTGRGCPSRQPPSSNMSLDRRLSRIRPSINKRPQRTRPGIKNGSIIPRLVLNIPRLVLKTVLYRETDRVLLGIEFGGEDAVARPVRDLRVEG